MRTAPPRSRSFARGLGGLVACVLTCGTSPVAAFDYSLSSFATLGYAISDRPYAYQRFIDNDGTVKRDSVAGLQVDAKIDGGLGATVQVKVAAATDDDRTYAGSVSWAFLSYRPSNDWLFRAGKQRIPFYLYSESYDVGATYDFARLPIEMYSIAPSNDFVGLSFARTFKSGGGDLLFDGYYGVSTSDFRFYFRDGIPGLLDAGALNSPIRFRGGGLVLTYLTEQHRFRIGVLRADGRIKSGARFPVTFPFVPVAPGIGYYQTDAALPGPGIPTASRVVNYTVTTGADITLPADFHAIGEYAHTVVGDSVLAPRGNRGYLSILEHRGKWTPYVTWSFLRSPAEQLALYSALDASSVPSFVPGAALINAAQRAGADQNVAYDQRSWAFGTSYSFSATSKLKAEFLRTHVGTVSQLFDAPAGRTVQHEAVNVLSLSYSVVY